MDIKVGKTKVMTISRQPFPAQIMIAQNQMQNVEYFICLGTMITNDARCTREITYRIAMAKAGIQQEEDSFLQQIGLNMEETCKMLHLEHSFVLYCNLDTSGSKSEIP